MGVGIAFLAASFFATDAGMTTVFRVAASFALVCGYLVSVGIRITDTYQLWPATETALPDSRLVRTLGGTIGFYTFVVLVLVSFWGLVIWLAG